MVNAIAKNAAVMDEITCYMLSGQYYTQVGEKEKGTKQLNHAYDLAKEFYEKQPQNKQLEGLKKRLETLLGIEA